MSELDFSTVDLDDLYKNTETGATKGLVIDGVFIRVDDMYLEESETNAANMCVDYKIVDGTPSNMVEFEDKIVKILIAIAQEENREEE